MTPIEQAAQALRWYEHEAKALAKHLQGGAHTQAVIASLTVLSLDAGRRAEAARAALASLEEPLTDAARDVLTERRRQVEAEGWAPEHDDEHIEADMAVAAACYALTAAAEVGNANQYWRSRYRGDASDLWPWERRWWKPGDPRRMLVKAGALILAEIERLDRDAAPSPGSGT